MYNNIIINKQVSLQFSFTWHKQLQIMCYRISHVITFVCVWFVLNLIGILVDTVKKCYAHFAKTIDK